MDCGLEGKTFKRPSLCKPQFAADCDISTIIQRFLKTGQLPQTPVCHCIEGDFTSVGDFQQLQDQCVAVRQQFDQLSIDERNKFNNDPVAWFESMIKTPDPAPAPAAGLAPSPAPGSAPSPVPGSAPSPAPGSAPVAP